MSQSHLLRQLPAVNDLLETPQLQQLAERSSHAAVVHSARVTLDQLRNELRSSTDEIDTLKLSVEAVAARVACLVEQEEKPALRPVINATGILLHTGLGRAPLPQAAINAMSEISRSYASVELDLVSGKRSQRAVAVERLLTELTGAEAALVVNNNAGATLLTLAAMASGREVPVSRGELIEIGGSFRLPDVMSVSRAKLHEVGTTNKTRLSDYEQAINESTAALLLVHPSNFAVVGFSSSVTLEELVALGRERGVPVIHDIGSGALINFSEYGFADEPVATDSVAAGADVVLFSGDKLLGGPQAGVIIGKREHVSRIASHPLARAFRVDKLTLAALRETLQLYRHTKKAKREIPLLQLLGASVDSLRTRAGELAGKLIESCPGLVTEVVDETTFLGGGSLPAQQLSTVALAFQPRDAHSSLSVEELAASLRSGTPAIVGRINQGRLLLDLRSVFPGEDSALADAVQTAATGK
ncbi:MAG: L-seryl-tRNA(Sec) selenium transferase [Pirellulales bacterium]|nr:L-seryl-tRNA(Sec) selenium transferase [Pirellulales bacterium]